VKYLFHLQQAVRDARGLEGWKVLSMPMPSPLHPKPSTGSNCSGAQAVNLLLNPFCPLLELYPQFGSVLVLFCGRILFKPEAASTAHCLS
jgi:hypothetical protein